MKISERKTLVPEREFSRYYDDLQARADRYIAAQRRFTPAEARTEFEQLTGRTPEAWLESRKRDELEDSAENMDLYTRVVSIRSAEARAHATHQRLYRWRPARSAAGPVSYPSDGSHGSFVGVVYRSWAGGDQQEPDRALPIDLFASPQARMSREQVLQFGLGVVVL